MFFFVRLVALAMLGPWALQQLERNFVFGLVLSSISVVLTIWLVIDTINAFKGRSSMDRRLMTMFDYRSWASMLLALGLCNACIGVGVLLTRERVWLPLARWLASLSNDHLSSLLGVFARGQIIIGLALLVAAIIVVRRAVWRGIERDLEPKGE